MKYIVNLIPKSPISLREGRTQTDHSTLDYIPGSIVHGTLASAHALLREDGTEFNQFFFDEVSFSNLYPALFRHKDLQGEMDPVYPLPATTLTCKRFSGFKDDYDEADPESNRPHGVWDGLIAWTLFALSGQQNYDALDDNLKDCPMCNESLDRIDGFYRHDELTFGKAKLEKTIRTRTGIDRRTGVVQHGILYSREAVSPETNFWGTLSVSDDHGDEFYEFVEETQGYGLLRVGNNRTRGFGNVTLNLEEAEEEVDSVTALEERVRAFNAELQQQANNQIYVPITLISDIIVQDSLLRFCRAIEPYHLATRGIPEAEPIYQNSSTRRVMGWHHLWGMPKADELAISMGSVFLFGFKQPFNDWQALFDLQTEGLGLRRREGFGQLMIANPFHWEVKGL